MGIVQNYSIRRTGVVTRSHTRIEQYELRDRYSGATYACERWLVRGFIHVAMDRYLRRAKVAADARWNIARWWVYLPAGMRRWRRYIPGGIATSITYSPDASLLPDGVRIDGITKRFFRHSLDAVGLRTRSYLLMEIAARQLMSRGHLRWVSLGAGMGHVASEFLGTVSPELRTHIELTLVDRDSHAVAIGRQSMARLRRVKCRYAEADVTIARELRPLLAGKPELVDALGLIEYLADQDITTLVKRAYQALASGGSLVMSNMADDRPELNVHQRAVGWPGVIVRSPRQIVQLIRAADVPASSIRCMRADDAVYYVFEVVKP